MVLLLLACTAPPAAAPADTALADTADTGPTEAPVDLAPPENGVQLTMGPMEVPPGTERYLCKTTRLPNTTPMDIVALEHQATSTMHHFNIWGLATGVEGAEGDCDTLWSETSMQLASPLYASQEPTFYGAFPDGIAARLPADQLVLLEFHVINPTTEPLYAEARFNAYAAEAGEVEAYANGIYGSNAEIEIPPHSAITVERDCRVNADVEVFALGSHFHSRGRLFEIYTLDGDGAPDELVYSNDDYTSPELLIRSDDPIHVAAGGGFHFACHYENDTDHTITYGATSDDEMCMMVGIYYPDQGFLSCGR